MIQFEDKSIELPSRDVQVSKVYAAERATAHWGKDPIGDRSEGDVQAFLTKIIKSNCWRTCCKLAGRDPLDYEGPILDWHEWGAKSASANRHEVTMGKASAFRSIMLHEIAHAAFPTEEALIESSHHWPFVKLYLRLVRRFMGADAEYDLKYQLRLKKARFSPKRKHRQLSEARYAVLRSQVAKMNEAKRNA